MSIPENGVPVSRFPWLLAAASVSNLGDGLRLAALPLLATTITQDPARIAGLTAAIWLPWVVFGLLAGIVVDRVDRQRLIRGIQLVRAVVMIGLGLSVLYDTVRIEAIYAVAFLIGIGEVFVDPALQSLVPNVVRRDDLERANGQLLAAETIGNELAGPPTGALLFAVAPSAPFIGDAISYAASSLAIGRVSAERRAASPSAAHPTLWRGLIEGGRYIADHPYLRVITVWGAIFNVGSTAAFSLLVLYVLNVLGLGEAVYGLLLGGTAVGGVMGTVIASTAVRCVGRATVMRLGMIVSSTAVIGVGLTRTVWLAGLLLFVSSMFGVLVNVVGRALRQALVPSHLIGRSYSYGRVFVYGAMPIGAWLGGWIGSTYSISSSFLIGGAIMLCVSILVSPLITSARVALWLDTHEQMYPTHN